MYLVLTLGIGVIVQTKYSETQYFHIKIQPSVAITGDDMPVKIYIRQKYLSKKKENGRVTIYC